MQKNTMQIWYFITAIQYRHHSLVLPDIEGILGKPYHTIRKLIFDVEFVLLDRIPNGNWSENDKEKYDACLRVLKYFIIFLWSVKQPFSSASV